MLETPLPYDETVDSDRFWNDDPFDDVLPSRKGFLTDYVYHHRGKEITTLYTIWAALFALTSAIKREAWMSFGNGRIYTNFYCILIGPAGIAHKTETINDTIDILEDFNAYIRDEQFRFMKYLNIISDKASPEALLEAMNPRNKEPKGKGGFYFKDKNDAFILNPESGKAKYYAKTAESAITASEFSTLAGMQRYNAGLIDNLLALYDCSKPFKWYTVKRRKVELKLLHTTMLAGTTLTSFRNSVSETTRTDGFLSRSILVNCPKTVGRRFSRPRVVQGAPSIEELKKRLAWIAEHTVGEFDLSPEADAYYDTWYNRWREELENDTKYQGVQSRMAVNVLKLALLIHAQGYNRGPNVIELQDVKDAIKILRRTWFEAQPILHGFEDNTSPSLGRLEDWIREHGTTTRLDVLRRGKFSAAELQEGLTYLIDEGKVSVYSGDVQKGYPSKNGSEEYRWCGERWIGSDGQD